MKNIFILAALCLLSANAVADTADSRFKACQSKLVKAQKLDILVDIKPGAGGFEVVVGKTFYTMPFDSKEGFAETLNCMFNAGEIGKKSMCNDISFVNWSTGNEDGEYTRCKLKMRR